MSEVVQAEAVTEEEFQEFDFLAGQQAPRPDDAGTTSGNTSGTASDPENPAARLGVEFAADMVNGIWEVEYPPHLIEFAVAIAPPMPSFQGRSLGRYDSAIRVLLLVVVLAGFAYGQYMKKRREAARKKAQEAAGLTDGS